MRFVLGFAATPWGSVPTGIVATTLGRRSDDARTLAGASSARTKETMTIETIRRTGELLGRNRNETQIPIGPNRAERPPGAKTADLNCFPRGRCVKGTVRGDATHRAFDAPATGEAYR